MSCYVLLLAFLVTVVTFVVTNDRMRFVLGWVFTSFFILFLGGLVDSALQISQRLPPPACYVRMLWEIPDTCMERLFPAMQVRSAPFSPYRIAQAGPERLWFAQASDAAAPDSVRDTPYDRGWIYVHVGPDIPKSDIPQIVEKLTALGWPTVDGIDGVQIVRQIPNNNQVRYFDAPARQDAIGLARALKLARPGTEVYVSDFTKSGLVARKGLLEVWISN